MLEAQHQGVGPIVVADLVGHLALGELDRDGSVAAMHGVAHIEVHLLGVVLGRHGLLELVLVGYVGHLLPDHEHVVLNVLVAGDLARAVGRDEDEHPLAVLVRCARRRWRHPASLQLGVSGPGVGRRNSGSLALESIAIAAGAEASCL